jgi:solute carrier family 25 iron transporter 28/37
MVQTEGAKSLFAGIRVVAGGAGPAHALYFSTYEQCKYLFGVDAHAEEHFPAATGTLLSTFVNMQLPPLSLRRWRMTLS